MMQHFFADEAQLPASGAWHVFGRTHLLMLALMLGLGLLLCLAYRRADSATRRRLRRAIGWGNLAFELFKDCVLVVTGFWGLDYLPLHLCGFALMLCGWDALRPSDTTHQVLYGLCLPGAAAALLFPNWTIYPVTTFRCWHSFITHALLVTYVLMQLFARDLRPQPRHAWKCAVFLACIVPPVWVFNKIMDYNYLFINWPSPGSPLELFGEWFGVPGYLIPYAGLFVMVCGLMYLPYIIKQSRQRTA